MSEALHRLLEAERIVSFSVAVNIGSVELWDELLNLHFGEVVTGKPGLRVDDLRLNDCGLIRVGLGQDTPQAVRAAERTIMRCAPALILECTGHAAAGLARGLGYRELLRVGNDRVFVVD